MEFESPEPDPGQSRDLQAARRKLEAPKRGERFWPAVVAAAFFAIAALVFAAVAILAPPNTHSAPAKTGVR